MRQRAFPHRNQVLGLGNHTALEDHPGVGWNELGKSSLIAALRCPPNQPLKPNDFPN